MQICVFVCVPELKLAELRALSETCDMFHFFFRSESSLFSRRLYLLPPVRPPVDNADVCPASMLWIMMRKERKIVVFIESGAKGGEQGQTSPSSSWPRSRWTPWRMGSVQSYVFVLSVSNQSDSRVARLGQ